MEDWDNVRKNFHSLEGFYDYKMVDSMVTNFHTPKSTLMMMVSAFADIDLLKKAYREAKKNDYRFLSYGDAMIIE